MFEYVKFQNASLERLGVNRPPLAYVRRTEALRPRSSKPGVGVGTQTVDYLVIGAGPAGLQLGYFLDRAGRDYVILEAGSAPGRFFKTFRP